METHLTNILLPGQGKSRLIECPVIQSPLAGITDKIFRKLIRRWAPNALLFTEMVKANSLNMGHGLEKLEELQEEEGPIGVQLFDSDINSLVHAATKAEELGAFLIDINMGCPVKKISRGGGGSGLLKTPYLAQEIVKEVSQAIKIPLTVKMRLGWCHESSNPVEFALKLQEAGAQLLTVHGRTKKQGFTGKSNWEAIAAVKKALDIPVIANGDIKTAEDAFRCLNVTEANGIMIGRGIMGSPWVIGQICSALNGKEAVQTPEANARVQLALDHLNGLLNEKGDHGLLIARKHLNWTCRGFPGATELCHKLLRTTSPCEAIGLLEKQLILLS